MSFLEFQLFAPNSFSVENKKTSTLDFKKGVKLFEIPSYSSLKKIKNTAELKLENIKLIPVSSLKAIEPKNKKKMYQSLL